MKETSEQVPRGLGAVILAGGFSRRLGSDKAALIFQGRSFLQIIAGAAGSVCDPVVVSVRSGQQLPPSYITIVDQQPSQGPLEGIRVGLKALTQRCDRAFVTGCDSPLLKPAVISWLDSKLGPYQAVVPFDDSHQYGLTAIYRTAVHVDVGDLLAKRKRRVIDLVDALDTRLVSVDELRTVDSELESLVNVNTSEDYDRLQRRD